MANASERGWVTPTPTVRVPCAGIPLNLHPSVAPIFAELIRRVEAIKGKGWMTSSGGYNPRPVRGYEKKFASTQDEDYLSNHAWAIAADFRAGTNPMSAKLITDMPPEIRSIAAELNLRWGGAYVGRKDPMHFEWMGTPAEAAAFVKRLNTKDDDVLKDQFGINPYSHEPEQLDVTLTYLEQRVREGLAGDLKPIIEQAIADALAKAGK